MIFQQFYNLLATSSLKYLHKTKIFKAMTKVYLVRSVRVKKKGEKKPYSVVENVFTNYKKALIYIEWLKKDYAKNERPYWVLDYKVDTWNIDTCDYSKVPF